MEAPPEAREEAGREAPLLPTGRALLVLALVVVLAISALYVVLPAIAGLKATTNRLSEGDVPLLVLAGGLEILSFASYVILFRGVFAGPVAIGWRESYRITMAGVAATRLLAAAGRTSACRQGGRPVPPARPSPPPATARHRRLARFVRAIRS